MNIIRIKNVQNGKDQGQKICFFTFYLLVLEKESNFINFEVEKKNELFFFFKKITKILICLPFTIRIA